MVEEKDGFAVAMIDSGDGFTETVFLLYGLDLKEQQYVSVKLLSTHRTNCIQGTNSNLCSHQ